jgi:hypothetical protein
MDEVVHVFRDFFRREKDPTAAVHPIVDRHDWFYDDEGPVEYGPEDADPTMEWTLYHDRGLPDDIPDLPRKDRIALAWEREWAEALVDVQTLRDKMKVPDMPDHTAEALTAVLKPIFATGRVHRRPGLFFAAQSLLEFVFIRSRSIRIIPTKSGIDVDLAQTQPYATQQQINKQPAELVPQ